MKRTKHLSCQEEKADNEMYFGTDKIFSVCVFHLYVLFIYKFTQAFKWRYISTSMNIHSYTYMFALGWVCSTFVFKLFA